MRKRATAVGLLLACVSAASACSPQGAEGSALCDALAAPVPGIDEIVWDNGFTRQEANWATLLDSGIIDSDEATQRASAAAVKGDNKGFEQVLDVAPSSLRPDLQLLRDVLMKPDEVEVLRVEPSVVEAIHAVRNATPPDVCGWVR